jgi:hypothetical protein
MLFARKRIGFGLFTQSLLCPLSGRRSAEHILRLREAFKLTIILAMTKVDIVPDSSAMIPITPDEDWYLWTRTHT